MNLQDAVRQTIQLMSDHGLLAKGWTFALDASVRRGGFCNYRKKRITLSRHFVELNPWEGADAVKNLALHEIAHALAGPRTHHGPAWKKVAQAIGCTGARCHAAVMPERQYVYECPNGHQVKRHRLIKDRPLACSVCCRTYNKGKFDERFLLVRK